MTVTQVAVPLLCTVRLKPPVARQAQGMLLPCRVTWSRKRAYLSAMNDSLQLTSLSGEEYQVIVDLQEFDRFSKFETAVPEHLPHRRHQHIWL